LGQQLDRRLSPIGAGWVEQIRQLVDEVDSLEQLRDRLFELHPNMTLDDYASVMADAMTAATLAGRTDIQGAGD
ncbi:DUF935 family protein, partial [Stenotrophomonas maltophilia]|nr:DUF935 family protein [Stenotrophomonas maltophilia]